MRNVSFELKSAPSKTYLATKAANSLDIDQGKKLTHKFNADVDIDTEFSVGLVYGSSGSGKTTLVEHLYGGSCFEVLLDPQRPVIEQFPESLDYEEISTALNGVGLSAVTCWIRPASTLSNGQKFRAEVALQIARKVDTIVIDEWTSVVDRTVAKAMSYAVQKHARRTKSKIVLCSCHYDVLEWLNPCWVIDCNTQSYTDRRSLWRGYKRTNQLNFEVRKCHRRTWKSFSKYHYLSENLPGGHIETYGLFIEEKQIGFMCFANYVPWSDKTQKKKMHSNRVVIHPDYVGFGLGLRFVNICSEHMSKKNVDIWAKLSAAPLIKSRMKEGSGWVLTKIEKPMKVKKKGKMGRASGFRVMVKSYVFRWVGDTKAIGLTT